MTLTKVHHRAKRAPSKLQPIADTGLRRAMAAIAIAVVQFPIHDTPQGSRRTVRASTAPLGAQVPTHTGRNMDRRGSSQVLCAHTAQ